MSDITTLMMAASGGVAGAYEISRSLRFNSADSAYLSRTPASAGSGTTWTWNFWVKRSKLGTQQVILRTASAPFAYIYFDTNDTLGFTGAAGISYGLVTSQVFRDVSSWYMLTFVADTTSATSTLTGSATDRLRLYVNGVQVSAFSSTTVPTQNLDTLVNGVRAHYFGGNVPSNNLYCDFYVAEFHAVDGQALTPSSFGEINEDTGVWSPIAYAGSYGTNGFYLNFSDNSGVTSSTLGKDSSGNGNNWTPNNFSVTAGAGNDSLVDTPTPYGTDTGAGGEVRGNYCTLNPLNTTGGTLSNGNLDYAMTNVRCVSNFAMASEKWYCEVTVASDVGTTSEYAIGVSGAGFYQPNGFASGTASVMYYAFNGNKYVDGSASAYGATFAASDIIGVALDADAGTVTFYKNNSSQGSITLPSSSSGWVINLQATASGTNVTFNTNFGQRPFSYTAPSGFKALCTTNLPDPTVVQGDDHFNTVLYTGNSSSQSITGVGFQPDLVWTKSRSQAYYNSLNDAVRGAGQSLSSNVTDAELNYSAYFSSFDSDGFTLPTASNVYNSNFETYVAWNWKANGAGVSNTDGTITSTVSANQTAGISIVTYTGTGSAATVGHGLGVAPSMILVKVRSGGVVGWVVYHSATGASQFLVLNNTDAASGAFQQWNSTAPTSTVFSLSGGGANSNINTYTYVAYCFAAIPGFSAFGSYTGNGSSTDGPFVYTGFRPAWILVKRTDDTGNWGIFDSTRNTFNSAGRILYPDLSNAEADSPPRVDFLSNGFKLRTDGYPNNAATTLIYMAFSEVGFKYALGR